MYFLIYKIKNKVDGKIYIGSHQTHKIEDDYMGSGSLILKAIKKYGLENFEKEILFECSSAEEMFNKEKELVNSDFLKRSDVYNMVPGGGWGYYRINQMGLNKYPELKKNAIVSLQKAGVVHRRKLSTDTEYRIKFCKSVSDGLRRSDKIRFRKGHPVSEETKKKISEKNRISLIGSVNCNYNTCWIYSDSLKSTARIKKTNLDYYLNEGWQAGRKMKYQNIKL